MHAPSRSIACSHPLHAVALAVVMALAAAAVQAQAGAADIAAAQSVEVTGRHYDNAVGTSDAASQGVIRAELLKSRPALRPGEVLEFIPGLIVTQHSGDGKANQYFLRGFNLDHGTDFATRLDGMPVNLPTHGHGQGYTDINFLIPELVQRIGYRKGPYFADRGDFASAGAADVAYRQRLDAPFGQLTLGENGYRRGVLGASFEVASGVALLGAFEAMHNDGPWTVPERLRKANGVLTLSGGSAAQGWHLSAMGYDARWVATDQIPADLIGQTYGGRTFGRFDSLDPTTGGDTARYSLSGAWHRDGAAGRTRVSAYAMHYELDLNSNFTYALERPDEGGDQFKQRDERNVYGLDASHGLGHLLGGLPARSEFGVQLRHDRVRVGLYDSVARRITRTTREDRVRETMLGVYGQSAVEVAPWARVVAGLRADHVRSTVDALTLAANGGRSDDTQVSPKLSLILGPFDKTEFFVNAGRGLHSNDARGTTARVDPKTGDAVDPVPPLVASKGFEVGARTEALPGLQSSIALWKLDFDSELVYVGDAGATEASGASRRRGIEFSNRWTPLPWFLLDADFAWTHARFANGDRIPNAVDKVASVAATLRSLGPWSASVQWRYLGSGALVEDNSQRSASSLTTNLRAAYRFTPKTELTLDVFNLFDRQVDDIQYYYASQVPGRAAQEGRHVHPAEPRAFRVTLRADF
ncbi:TonB-dependent receptor [Aquincola sp. MAHUQ-54]|uniref:TonB-dependent receptor n=1 Tax=Aquincola agrisoli TaxID=3119538 RepID=A0AAW9QBX0_9BURK